MVVPSGIRYLRGVRKSSVRNHPLMSATLVDKLYSSIESWGGSGSLCVSTSLMTTGTMAGGPGSSALGEPSTTPLGRHSDFKHHFHVGACSFTTTSENPK